LFTNLKNYMQVQNSSQNNINFTSNIRFISRSGFEKILKNPKTRIVGEMYTKAQLLEVKDIAATTNIQYCLAGVFKKISEKKDLFYHLMPRRYYWKTPEFPEWFQPQHLVRIKEELKNLPNSEKLKTFLIGGLQKENLEDDCKVASKASTKLLADLRDALAGKLNLDFTAFFRQKTPRKDWYSNPNISLAYNKKADTYYVSVCEKQSKRKLVDILDPQKLKEHFEYIEVSDNDKIFVQGKHVPNEFWNIK